jgi:hypothetical protein
MAMTQTYRLITAALLLWIAPRGTAAAQISPDADAEPAARAVLLLEQSGYRYTKETPWLWSVPFTGTHLRRVSVWVMTNDKELIVESVIARSDQMGRLPAVMRPPEIESGAREGLVLLALDEEGNYVARSRFGLESLEPSTFQSSLQAIVTAADAAYGTVKGWLTEDVIRRAAVAPGRFGMPAGATSRLDLLRGRASVSFNPTLWKETQSADLDKRTFQYSDTDGFAMIVAEPVTIPLAQLRDRALANMRQTGSDIQVVEEERRHVNGTEIVSLQTNVTVQGIPFTYLGYYYGGPSGTVQVVTYTERGKFQDYQRQFEEFLNGLCVGQ